MAKCEDRISRPSRNIERSNHGSPGLLCRLIVYFASLLLSRVKAGLAPEGASAEVLGTARNTLTYYLLQHNTFLFVFLCISLPGNNYSEYGVGQSLFSLSPEYVVLQGDFWREGPEGTADTPMQHNAEGESKNSKAVELYFR